MKKKGISLTANQQMIQKIEKCILILISLSSVSGIDIVLYLLLISCYVLLLTVTLIFPELTN